MQACADSMEHKTRNPILGGGVRISTGTEAPRDTVPALKALQQYLSDSIIKED